jgi:hypothetical protein
MSPSALRRRTLLSGTMLLTAVAGYGRRAYAACVNTVGSTYVCSGANAATQAITGPNANNASVSTLAGFSVNTAAGNAITITGDGALSYTDTNGSPLTAAAGGRPDSVLDYRFPGSCHIGGPSLTLPWRGRVGSRRAKRDARRGGVSNEKDRIDRLRMNNHPTPSTSLRPMCSTHDRASSIGPLQGRVRRTFAVASSSHAIALPVRGCDWSFEITGLAVFLAAAPRDHAAELRQCMKSARNPQAGTLSEKYQNVIAIESPRSH